MVENQAQAIDAPSQQPKASKPDAVDSDMQSDPDKGPKSTPATGLDQFLMSSRLALKLFQTKVKAIVCSMRWPLPIVMSPPKIALTAS